MTLLAPSILSANLLELKNQIEIVEKNGADLIHIDVMDGRFVPNITFGPVIVRTLKKITQLPMDVHLMIVEPEKYVTEFIESGADYVTVHQEACVHLDRTLHMIKEGGAKAGVSINPATAVSSLENILSIADLILVMSVNPGFGGQSFIPNSLVKIARLKELRDMHNANYLIEVDGGINEQTAVETVAAGADILVAGKAVFNAPSIADACTQLKNINKSS